MISLPTLSWLKLVCSVEDFKANATYTKNGTIQVKITHPDTSRSKILIIGKPDTTTLVVQESTEYGGDLLARRPSFPQMSNQGSSVSDISELLTTLDTLRTTWR